MRRKVKWSVGILALVVVGGFAFVTWTRTRSVQLVEVQGVAVTQGAITASVKATGFVDAPQSYVVSAPQSAHLLQVRHQVGQRVRRGESLAVLDTALAAERVRNAEALVQVQKAQLRQAELDMHAEEAIWKAGGQTHQAVEQAQMRVNSSRAQLEATRSDVRSAHLQMAAYAVRAPVDGIVTEISTQAGGFVQAGTPLLSLASQAPLEARIKVDQGSVDQIRQGQKVELSIEGVPDRVGEATIGRIEPKMQKEGSSYYLVVVVAVPENGFPVKLNQQITARILTTSRPAALQVPLDVVIEKDGVDIVRVVSDGRIHVQRVRTGIQDGNRIEILDGLTLGQQVVRPHARQVLAEGTPVRLAKGAQP